MLADFRNICQNYLNTLIPPRTRTDGGLFGTEIPPSPSEVRSRLQGEKAAFNFNHWSLDNDDAEGMINQTVTIYTGAYGDWSTKPLPTEATPELIAWQKGLQG